MNVRRVDTPEGRPALRWGEDGRLYEYGNEGEAVSAFSKAVAEGLSRGETSGMTEAERHVALKLSDRVGVRKDAGGNLIVAWFLPQDLAREIALTVPGAVPPEEMHITLLFLGDPRAYDVELVTAVLKIYSSSMGWPLPGRVAGQGRFVGRDEDVLVALVDVPHLVDLRRSLMDELSFHGALNWDEFDKVSTHGFVPHVTLAYVPPSTPSPPPMTETPELSVDSVSAAWGDEETGQRFRADYPFRFADRREGEDAMPSETTYLAARTLLQRAGRANSGSSASLLGQARDVIDKLIAQTKGAHQDEEEEEGKKSLGDAELEYAVTKASAEKRYTFGPLYAPDRVDAHGEWTDAEALQEAVWGYVRDSAEKGRRINLQHDDSGEKTIGEWVEVVAWPYETEIEVAVPGEKARMLSMPAGTIYMGVVWDEGPAWDAIKDKRLTGYSLGGRAVRVRDAAGAPDEDAHMGDKLAGKKHGTHKFAGDDGGECKICGFLYKNGEHYGSDDKDARRETAEVAEALSSALSTALQTRREEERERERGWRDVLDRVLRVAERETPTPVVNVNAMGQPRMRKPEEKEQS